MIYAVVAVFMSMTSSEQAAIIDISCRMPEETATYERTQSGFTLSYEDGSQWQQSDDGSMIILSPLGLELYFDEGE